VHKLLVRVAVRTCRRA